MPARTTRLVFSFTSPSWTSPSLCRTTFGMASGESGLGFSVLEVERLQRQLLLDVVLVERRGVEKAHLRAHLADLQALLLQLRCGGLLEHDLVAALAVDLVGDD